MSSVIYGNGPTKLQPLVRSVSQHVSSVAGLTDTISYTIELHITLL